MKPPKMSIFQLEIFFFAKSNYFETSEYVYLALSQQIGLKKRKFEILVHLTFNWSNMDNFLSYKLCKVASEERIVSGTRVRTNGASVVRGQRLILNNFLKQGLEYCKREILLRYLLLFFFHKCFPVAHLWPSQSPSLCTFLFLQPTHFGLPGLGE